MKISRLLLALLAVLALLAGACGDDDDSDVASSGDDGGASQTEDETTDGTDAPDGPPIRIGAQDFGESAILAEIYGQVLEANGYEVEMVSVGGFREVLLAAFDNG